MSTETEAILVGARVRVVTELNGGRYKGRFGTVWGPAASTSGARYIVQLDEFTPGLDSPDGRLYLYQHEIERVERGKATPLDELASLARTALTDPYGLPLTEAGKVLTGPLGAFLEARQDAYAVDRLDEIINTLCPSEWTRESAAVALRVLGRHVSDVMDGLGEADVIEAGRCLIGDQLDGALDLIDSAIRSLEGDDDE